MKDRGKDDPKKLASDALAWAGNVGTSVLIVFVNKVLMDPRKGYKFSFATTLCALHFLCAAAFVSFSQLVGWTSKAPLPWRVNLYFAVVASISIASLNLSLLVNSVGFYQIAKLLIIPFVCIVELVWMGRRFTAPIVASITLVIIGVAIVTVTDVNVQLLGLVVAAVSVVSSGMQQVLCGTIQRQHKLQSHQLLANTAPVQGVMLLLVGPLVDKGVTGLWVTRYTLTAPAAGCLLLSCAISVGVNISQFMCLGRFSAVTFQVLGHTKTILVLLISWGVLHEHMSARKALGMALAVGGMVMYGFFNSLARGPSGGSGRAANGSSAETKPLLPVTGGKVSPGKEAAPDGPLLPRSSSNGYALARSRNASTQDLTRVVAGGTLPAPITTEKRSSAAAAGGGGGGGGGGLGVGGGSGGGSGGGGTGGGAGSGLLPPSGAMSSLAV